MDEEKEKRNNIEIEMDCFEALREVTRVFGSQ